MAVDMINFAYKDNYDTAIIVTGDGDFAEAINAVKDHGKHVEHAYFQNSSNALRRVSDRFIVLNHSLLNTCLP